MADVSVDDGDSERDHTLVHFQEVTGLTDVSQCQRILQSHGWNLEAAVQDAISIQEGGQPVFSTPPRPLPVAPRPQVMHSGIANVRRNQQPQGWWEWLVGWAFLPVRLVISTINEITQFIFQIIGGNHLPGPAGDPVGDVRSFISQYEEEYGPEHPPFLTCSYGDALEDAKQNLKFLLVYIHSAGHHDTPIFCREVMSSDFLRDFLSTRGCLLFGVGINSEEGTRVSYILRESTYPFLALIMLKGSRMTVIGRFEGYIPLADMVDQLDQLMTTNEPELVVLRTERQQRSLDQQIRREQEEEYLKSLEADKEKARRREEEMQRALEVEEEERMRELKEQEMQEALEQEIELRRQRVPMEPDEQDPQAIHIIIRLPDGTRLERRFTSNDLLQSVYDFAYTHDDIPSRFTLAMNYPRKELLCDNMGGPLLGKLNLGKKCLLFMQDNTE